MRVVDPGHVYDLVSLDGGQVHRLTFVKRLGERYPGNVGFPHAGTNMQEVLRATEGHDAAIPPSEQEAQP